MTVTAAELETFTGKNVKLVINREGQENVELEGKIELASEVGVAFKPRRKRDVDFIEPAHIVSIEEIAEPASDLKQKTLPPVDAAKVRAHLIDRHGAPLSQVNGMTDEQALTLHGKIPHDDLGHKHLTAEEQAEKERKAAEKKAEKEAASAAAAPTEAPSEY